MKDSPEGFLNTDCMSMTYIVFLDKYNMEYVNERTEKITKTHVRGEHIKLQQTQTQV